ncbi:hypothetical protein HAX54_046316, partial [Datura stramonium]|nr:hypothetical protein [Datura stramonium]
AWKERVVDVLHPLSHADKKLVPESSCLLLLSTAMEKNHWSGQAAGLPLRRILCHRGTTAVEEHRCSGRRE